eukprot:scaffold9267_cov112-Isochrysis_galbana.AAC.7
MAYTLGERLAPTAPCGYDSSGAPRAARTTLAAATWALSSAVWPSFNSWDGCAATSPIAYTRLQRDTPAWARAPETRSSLPGRTRGSWSPSGDVAAATSRCSLTRSRPEGSRCESNVGRSGSDAGGAPVHMYTMSAASFWPPRSVTESGRDDTTGDSKMRLAPRASSHWRHSTPTAAGSAEQSVRPEVTRVSWVDG